jgi:hypothetical protein
MPSTMQFCSGFRVSRLCYNTDTNALEDKEFAAELSRNY